MGFHPSGSKIQSKMETRPSPNALESETLLETKTNLENYSTTVKNNLPTKTNKQKERGDYSG